MVSPLLGVGLLVAAFVGLNIGAVVGRYGTPSSTRGCRFRGSNDS